MLPTASHHRRLTVRTASSGDRTALERLAALDSAPPLADRALVAELDGTPVAAASLAGDAVIADPFERTGEIVEMLRLRVRQLSLRPRRARGLRPALAR